MICINDLNSLSETVKKGQIYKLLHVREIVHEFMIETNGHNWYHPKESFIKAENVTKLEKLIYNID